MPKLKESLYSFAGKAAPWVPTLGQLSTAVEYLAFGALISAFVALAGKGIAVAFGLTIMLTYGIYLTAASGFLLAFVALLGISILLDGGHQYRSFAKTIGEADDEDEDEARQRGNQNVRQNR